MIFSNRKKFVQIATITVIIYLLCFGIAMAFFPIRPFWNDEWRLIYNLKFKTESQLWGHLDLLQQFPRIYLIILKKITSYFDYSYVSLRLPALIISVLSILLCFNLKYKLYPKGQINSYLFVLILVSSQTFTDYLVQTKQYEMEILLSLLAIWQLVILVEIAENRLNNKSVYFLLCLSFLIAPFFSYTYPIAIIPILPIMLFKSIQIFKSKSSKVLKCIMLLYLPLLLALISNSVFYYIDVRQVLADKNMHDYWAYKMMAKDAGSVQFLEKFWMLFALVGSGLLFEIVFGILGIVSFFYGFVGLIKRKKLWGNTMEVIRAYAVLLIITTLVLFVLGKLPLGVPRLSVFTIPSIAILIIYLLTEIKTNLQQNKWSNGLSIFLILGLFGNIITTCINTFTYPEYKNKIKGYLVTNEAIKQARLAKLPILITEGAFSNQPAINNSTTGTVTNCNTYNISNIISEEIPSYIVLKTLPEYKICDSLQIYVIPDTKWKNEYMQQLPANIKSAIVADGISFIKIDR